MTAATFDTLNFVEKLEKAGVPSEQARAFSSALKESHDTAELATKQDLNLVRKDMDMMRKDMDMIRKDVDMVRKDVDMVRKDVDMVRTELNAKMDTLESRLIIKLGSITVATITVATAILAAVIRL